MQNTTFNVEIPRRAFVAGSAAAAASVLAARRALAASAQIGVGFIGYGLIGKRHVLDFQAQPDVKIVAVAECHQGRLEEARAAIGNGVRGYADFRKLLDDKDLQAVVISTPDHWHALMTVEACKAGKDVYVEKPACVVVEEGRKMVQAARKYNRIVQLGTQQRSGSHYHEAKAIINKMATTWLLRNRRKNTSRIG